MKNILSVMFCGVLLMADIGVSNAAVRDGNSVTRAAGTAPAQRVSNTTVRTTVARTTVGTNNVRGATARRTNSSAATTRGVSVSRSARAPGVTARSMPQRTVSRAATNENQTPIVSSSMSQTRTGAEYEQCKSAYFTCMDQFCALKNDEYRRCSCNNRVYELDELRDVLVDAGQQLTVFNENLDAVGMTAAQATAMRNESEGESALTSDTSASKALLQAIMNSIRGEDSSVAGRYSDLNSISLSFDTVAAFGTMDSGQVIATYNGQALYEAVYPQCRDAVRADCNDASLQRAITAYLMAVEQDCNTVQTAVENKQKQMKAAVRESSAMLDLARVENRKKHNSSDITTCINDVEGAILSEEVCGANYHKCLDNGEFIDISTGKPIAGVESFYKLGKQLVFASGVDAANQKLSKVTANRSFVNNFESRVKKFAEPALDKCVEQADVVWAEYLDKAMLAIYYAQQAKVDEIKQGCFDFVASCYVNEDNAITAAMAELTGEAGVVLQPDKVILSSQMCSDYINSCNSMFDGNIVADYVNNRTDTDRLAACRAVVKQCFDNFGGTNYENFYYPYSGLFNKGRALDWFTLYEYEYNYSCGELNGTQPGECTMPSVVMEKYNNGDNEESERPKLISQCAQQLRTIESCSDTEMIEKAFGGFDKIIARRGVNSSGESVFYLAKSGDWNGNDSELYDDEAAGYKKYGILSEKGECLGDGCHEPRDVVFVLKHHQGRPTGVATELYNQIIDILSTRCSNLQGRFVELQFVRSNTYNEKHLCLANFSGAPYAEPANLVELYAVGDGENMCPRDYDLGVDTQSWGMCSCWENGGRRSKWGRAANCVAAMPWHGRADKTCMEYGSTGTSIWPGDKPSEEYTADDWCLMPASMVASNNQVCPVAGQVHKSETSGTTSDIGVGCDAVKNDKNSFLSNLPAGLN